MEAKEEQYKVKLTNKEAEGVSGGHTDKGQKDAEQKAHEAHINSGAADVIH